MTADWLVKERLVAKKLKEKKRKEKSNLVSKGNDLLERKGYPVRYGIFTAIIHRLVLRALQLLFHCVY